jgi:DNA-binding NarL/FixJ family response regulator
MDFATKEQLLQIAMFEDCEIDLKYAAVRELQNQRKKQKDDYLQQIVYLFGKGLIVPQIAKQLCISNQKVEKVINQKCLWKTRYFREVKT